MFLNRSDDAVSVAPEVHASIYEDSSIRILDVIVPPGYKSPEHWHPRNVGYVLQGGTLRFTLSGIVKDVLLTDKQVTNGEGAHVVENIGDTEVRVIQVEFKD